MKNIEMIEKEKFIKEQMAFRVPRQISNILVDEDGSHFYCPSCNGYIERDYQQYCSECGQAIDWDGINFIADEE